MHYVGLRRVRNSSALHILNLNENKINVSEKVKSKMNRLRSQASLVPLAETDNSPQTKTILLQNVRSLHLHIDDVRSDYNIQKADVNIFAESKLFLSHISFLNLRFTEMTLVSLTEELAMELLCILRMI